MISSHDGGKGSSPIHNMPREHHLEQSENTISSQEKLSKTK